MAKTVIILLVLLAVSCKQVQSEGPAAASERGAPAAEIGRFHWLVGSWVRTNEKQGQSTYEIWNEAPGSTYQGLGFTLREEDTIWQERMTLKETSGIWTLNIWSPDQNEPVVFTLTDLSDSTFTSENPDHDFPKKILYRRHEKGISASVSNEEMEIAFVFVPSNE